jgi:endonuclease/exonuclease/phosphatase family metal-dependent hydrolase
MSNTRWLVLAAIVAALIVSLSCGGGSSSKKTARITIMDQNVLHGFTNEDPAAEPFDRMPERIQLISRALADAKPDVITLQEILAIGPEGYPDILGALRQALGSDYSQTLGDFQGDAIGQGSLGQLTMTDLPVVSTENRKVSLIRSVHRVTFQTKAGPVSIYNAHLEGTGALLETGAPVELQEIETVLSFIQETRNGGPAILAGDLNSEPTDPAIQRILQDGFVDALATAGDATCAKAGDPGCSNSNMPLGDNPTHNADHRIDFIFVLSGDGVTATVKDASRWDDQPVDIGGGHTLWPSDHIGMRVTIELTAK